MQVIDLFLNNWDKEHSRKLTLFSGLWLGVGDTFSVAYLP